MKLNQRIGAVGLVLVLMFSLLPGAALAADGYSYETIEGYTAASGLTVETASEYPWTYDASTGNLTSGNRDLNLTTAKATLSRLKVTVSQNGYLKFDYAMSASTLYDILTWRLNTDYAIRSDVTSQEQDAQKNGTFDFMSVGTEIPVSAGDVIYIAYSKAKKSADEDYGQLRNLRLVTGGTVTVSSSHESLGTVSADRADLTNLLAGTQITLTATENGGQFEGWYETIGDVTTRISGDNPFTYTVTEDAALQARFIGVAVNAVATIGSTPYDTLTDALADAKLNATSVSPVTVKLMRDVEITEDLTIPANVTLLVPYNAEDMGTDPEMTTKDVVRQKGSVYRKLTVASGATITVNGTLLVNASLASSDTGHQGSIGDDYGLMELNGTLVVNNGGALKARGMVTGSGSITAESGSEVWQAFEMTDWPGGSVAADRNGKGEFPISQYYFQRIQVTTTLKYGSSMSVYGYLLVPSEGNAIQLDLENLIGTADTSFFKMNEGSYVVMGYHAPTYTTTFELHGSVELRSFNISMAGYSISTASTICPIPASFAINVKEGANLTITENMKLMTGTALTIDQGATVTVEEGNELYLFSENDYNDPRVIPSTSDITLPIASTGSAVIFNSGTLQNNGIIHTSSGIDNQIQHLGTGAMTGSGTISYGTVGKTLVIYDANGGTGTVASQYVEAGASATLAKSGFTRAGFEFLGWSSDPDFYHDPFRNVNEVITDMNITEVPTLGKVKMTLYAVWKQVGEVDSSGQAKWKVSGTTYDDFNEALTAANAGSKMVVLANTGTLPAGDYVIPSGVRVLIPYNSQGSYDVNPSAVDYRTTAYVAPENPYTKLIMANGANITVNGELNVGSRIYSGHGGSPYSGAPTGNSAQINMQSGSSIKVNGTLYAYGFITGTGTVTAESGSTIHETFQLCEQPGGSALMNMTSGTFPMTQYYVQNIEVPLTYKYGCREVLHTNLYMMDQQNACDNIPFLGSDAGLFRMGSGSTATRTYDPNTDRITWDLDGNINLESTSMVVMGQSVDTANYNFPLTNNYTVNINSGTTTIHNTMEFLPGVRVTVDQDAELVVNRSLYVYDSADWIGKHFTYYGGDLIPVAYSPTRKHTRTSADLTDAAIDVNGTMRVNGGEAWNSGLLTTQGGAHIHSSAEKGKIIFNYQPPSFIDFNARRYRYGTATTDIPAEPARLHNADASGSVITSTDKMEYTETANYPVGTQFSWCQTHRRWESGTVNITFNANGGSGETRTVNVHTPGLLPVQKENFTRDNLNLKGWNTAADGSGTFYGDGSFMALYEDTTLYAQWYGNVTWVGGDGNVIRTEQMDYNAVPEFIGDYPTKATDAQYVYTFAGWSTTEDGNALSSIPKVTGNVTYYAVFTGEIRSYTITWKNWDDSVLSTETLNYGVTPEYTRELTRNGEIDTDWSIGYVFSGWDPAITAVTGDATYTAKFDSVVTYMIRFYNADGTALLNEVGALLGAFPKFPSGTPTPPSGYVFVGWATEPGGTALASIPACKGAAKYYAVFEKANSGLAGDIDSNGTVNSDDLSMLLTNYNKTGSGLQGDIDVNGTVNSDDLSALLANYNKTAS